MCANRTQVRHLLRREAAGELHLYFATIMRAFDAALLHVHRSKFTQFLLFHVRAPAQRIPFPVQDGGGKGRDS
jgi:hypothetical protein